MTRRRENWTVGWTLAQVEGAQEIGSGDLERNIRSGQSRPSKREAVSGAQAGQQRVAQTPSGTREVRPRQTGRLHGQESGWGCAWDDGEGAPCLRSLKMRPLSLPPFSFPLPPSFLFSFDLATIY